MSTHFGTGGHVQEGCFDMADMTSAQGLYEASSVQAITLVETTLTTQDETERKVSFCCS